MKTAVDRKETWIYKIFCIFLRFFDMALQKNFNSHCFGDFEKRIKRIFELSVVAVRFGRVPKREKAKILEQMQRVNVQCQGSLVDSIIADEVCALGPALDASAVDPVCYI